VEAGGCEEDDVIGGHMLAPMYERDPIRYPLPLSIDFFIYI
jgi:hypothetical protein